MSLRHLTVNPRPPMQQNPSGLAIAAIVGLLGIAGAGAYVVLKVRAAAEQFKKDFPDALRTVYISELGPLRFLPGGAIQFLTVVPGAEEGSRIVTKSGNVPIDASVGQVVAETLKGLSTDKADFVLPSFDDNNTYASYSAPGKLKVRFIPKERLTAALKGELMNKDAFTKFVEAYRPLFLKAQEEWHEAVLKKAPAEPAAATPTPAEANAAKAAPAPKLKAKPKAKKKK